MANVNNMDFVQMSTVLNDLYQQTTGQKPIAITNESEFVSVAQKVLKQGYDPVIGAISQVLSRTIFSIRPYSAKFKGLEVDNQKYGAITRKLVSIDKPFVDDDRLPLTEGSSVDQQEIRKPEVLQLNYYGANMYEDFITQFKDQLDTAFSSSAEFGNFWSMVITNINDKIEQSKEVTARMTINNLMAGVIAGGNTNQVVHLLTEFNKATGLEYTKADALSPMNIRGFGQWCYQFLQKKVDMLAERTSLFHTNLTGKTIMRHTPAKDLKVYGLSDFMNMFDCLVKSNTYDNSFLALSDVERVNFWQSATSPDSIKITPTYLQADGTLKTDAAAVEADNIVAVLFDRESAGMTLVNEWSAAAPFNARGGYTNFFWHFTMKYWNDFTENAMVIKLD